MTGTLILAYGVEAWRITRAERSEYGDGTGAVGVTALVPSDAIDIERVEALPMRAWTLGNE